MSFTKVLQNPRWFATMAFKLIKLMRPSKTSGHCPISFTTAQATFRILNQSLVFGAPIPYINTLPGGGVSIAWRTSRHDLNIEVTPYTTISAYFEDYDRDESWERNLNINNLEEVKSALYRISLSNQLHREWSQC